MEEELEAVDDVIEMYYMMFVQIQNDINWQNQTRDLYNAELSYADLTMAYLNGANLSYASLYDADLRYADLENADLSGADLTGVYWYDTTCPDGTNSNSNGNTRANNL